MGYIVPEPASLVSTQTVEKSMAMFRVWLTIRAICLLRLATKSSLAQPLPNKSWNALLTAEYASQRVREHEPGRRVQEQERLRSDMVSLMGNTLRENSDVQTQSTMEINSSRASWLGIPFDQLEPLHFQQILWELHELCFRFEFCALDCHARIGTPFENDGDSDILLINCVPENSFSVPTLATANHGIASSSVRECAHYLFAMARVMRRWRWSSSEGWISKASKLRWLPEEIDSLEKEIATTYTQSFWNCFRRAPVVPHHLSNDASERNPIVGSSHLPILAPHVDNNASIVINLQAMSA